MYAKKKTNKKSVVSSVKIQKKGSKKSKNAKKISGKSKKITKKSSKKQLKNKFKKGRIINNNALSTSINYQEANVVSMNKVVDKNEVASLIKDTVPEKVITILSAFKPALKNVSKINFNNAIINNMTQTDTFNYEVPSQNLSFLYNPIAIVPRAYKNDSIYTTNMSMNAKIGVGNYNSQFGELVFSKQDLNNTPFTFSVYTHQITAAPIKLQNKSEFGLQFLGSTPIANNTEVQSQLYFNQNKRYRYGLVPDTSIMNESNYLQVYSQFGTSLLFINKKGILNSILPTPYFKLERFNGLSNAINTSVEFSNPLSFNFNNNGSIHLDFKYHYNHYLNSLGDKLNTSIIQLNPFIEIPKWNTIIKTGASPTLLNGNDYKFNPIVYLERKLNDSNYILKTGWRTDYIMNGYGSLVMQNPWIQPSTDLKIESIERKYIELSINTSKSINYNVSLSMNDMRNLPLFKMDNSAITNGLRYYVVFEPRAINLELNGSMKYKLNSHLSITNTILYKQFTKIRENDKSWGIIPFEFKSLIDWTPNTKWFINGSVTYWAGSAQYISSAPNLTTNNAFILDANFSYNLTKKWNIWVKGENLLDIKYERWSYYPSLGVQILAGINYSFNK